MKLPLAGVRVVDLTVVWAGPFGTLLLADLGAEVIKVENIHVWQPLTRGSMARPPKALMGSGPSWTTGYPDDEPGERPWNRCPTFVNLYRNKRSVTMDIRVPEGRKPFEDLIRTADIVYENNVSETMEKLGITYDYLRSLRPDIIYIRVPAFGSSGAYRNYRALGVHLEGVSGHTLLRKYPDLDVSANTQIFAGDYFAGTHGAFAAIAALHYRNRTGKGQLIEIPQVEVATGMLAQFLMDYALNGRNGEALGNRDYHGAAPCGVYPAKSGSPPLNPDPSWAPIPRAAQFEPQATDRWIAITVCTDDDWRALGAVLGNPPWTGDPRFATAEGRRAHHDEIDRLLAEATRQWDVWELTRALQARGVAAGPVMNARDAFEDPHLRARGLFRRMTQVDCGDRDWVGPFIRTEEGFLPMHRPPVAMGEDNEYVYKTLLGYSDAAYTWLLEHNYIGDRFDDSIP
jgi:crotonobetainyl-CoA:carnitine CoA-transferase CaiB-like acyl-CoA transferase